MKKLRFFKTAIFIGIHILENIFLCLNFLNKILYLAQNLDRMLTVADALDMPFLKNLCEKVLLHRSLKWDIVSKFKYADNYNLITLKVLFLGLITQVKFDLRVIILY